LSAVGTPKIDQVEPVLGVPDRGDEPGVVAIDVAGVALCSGALLASDVVLTARHCVTISVAPQCPATGAQVVGLRPADSLRILVGDGATIAEERALARGILVPPGDEICGADIALLMLDRPIDDIQPLVVRATGAAQGDHVRTVSFFGAEKLLRDHVPVLDTTPTELRVAEGPCQGGGGPALDESTGEVVGVVSRAGPDASNVYTRVDRFLSLIARALEESASASARRTYAKKRKRGPADMGANCSQGADCAAGACVTSGVREYCSRRCSAHDRCPARFRCGRCDVSQEGPALWACVEN